MCPKRKEEGGGDLETCLCLDLCLTEEQGGHHEAESGRKAGGRRGQTHRERATEKVIERCKGTGAWQQKRISRL